MAVLLTSGDVPPHRCACHRTLQSEPGIGSRLLHSLFPHENLIVPLLTERLRRHVPWSQLALESVLVVVSVLLALALNAWYDHSQEQERVDVALRNVHAELTEMRGGLKNFIPVHQANVDTLRSDTLDFKAPLSLRLYDPPTQAWKAVQQTGVVALMDYELATSISGVYDQTERLRFMYKKSYDLTFDGPRYLGMQPDALDQFWGYLNDYVRVERRLLDQTEQALDAIEARKPSLKGSRENDAPGS